MKDYIAECWVKSPVLYCNNNLFCCGGYLAMFIYISHKCTSSYKFWIHHSCSSFGNIVTPRTILVTRYFFTHKSFFIGKDIREYVHTHCPIPLQCTNKAHLDLHLQLQLQLQYFGIQIFCFFLVTYTKLSYSVGIFLSTALLLSPFSFFWKMYKRWRYLTICQEGRPHLSQTCQTSFQVSLCYLGTFAIYHPVLIPENLLQCVA